MNKYQLMLEGWRARHNCPLTHSYDDVCAYRYTFGNGATLTLHLKAFQILYEDMGIKFDTSDETAVWMAERLAANSTEVLVAIEPVVK